MRTILTDASGDFARGPTRWATGKEAARVKLEYRLRTSIGEWMLNRAFGLDRDRLRDVGDAAPLPPEVEVTRVVAASPGIRRVVQVSLQRPTTEQEARAIGLLRQWRANPGRVCRIDVVAEVETEEAPVTFPLDLFIP